MVLAYDLQIWREGSQYGDNRNDHKISKVKHIQSLESELERKCPLVSLKFAEICGPAKP